MLIEIEVARGANAEAVRAEVEKAARDGTLEDFASPHVIQASMEAGDGLIVYGCHAEEEVEEFLEDDGQEAAAFKSKCLPIKKKIEKRMETTYNKIVDWYADNAPANPLDVRQHIRLQQDAKYDRPGRRR